MRTRECGLNSSEKKIHHNSKSTYLEVEDKNLLNGKIGKREKLRMITAMLLFPPSLNTSIFYLEIQWKSFINDQRTE